MLKRDLLYSFENKAGSFFPPLSQEPIQADTFLMSSTTTGVCEFTKVTNTYLLLEENRRFLVHGH